MSTASPPFPRRGGRTAAVLLQLVLLLVTLLASEVAYRGWLRLRGSPYQATAAEAAIRQAVFAVHDPTATSAASHDLPTLFRGFAGPHPYVGWEMPDGGSKAVADTAAQLQRSGPDSYKVMVVGGSVAALLVLFARDTFVQHIEADPRFRGKHVDVLLEGRAGFKQPQPLFLLEYLMSLGLVPDAVISVDGFNDVAAGTENARNGVNPVYPNHGIWRHIVSARGVDPTNVALVSRVAAKVDQTDRLGRLVLEHRLYESALVGDMTIGVLSRLRQQWADAVTQYLAQLKSRDDLQVRGPAFDADQDAVIGTLVTAWKESVRSMYAICAARGIPYLHVLQPALHDPGTKPLTPEEIATGGVPQAWIDGVHTGYDRLRAAGAELAALGVPFFDATRIFADVHERVYTDSCHFNEAGDRFVAARIADEFLRVLPADPFGRTAAVAAAR